MCYELRLIGKVKIPLHMMEQTQLVGLMPREENHDSRQDTPESVPQSRAKGETIIIMTIVVKNALSFGLYSQVP